MNPKILLCQQQQLLERSLPHPPRARRRHGFDQPPRRTVGDVQRLRLPSWFVRVDLHLLETGEDVRGK